MNHGAINMLGAPREVMINYRTKLFCKMPLDPESESVPRFRALFFNLKKRNHIYEM